MAQNVSAREAGRRLTEALEAMDEGRVSDARRHAIAALRAALRVLNGDERARVAATN